MLHKIVKGIISNNVLLAFAIVSVGWLILELRSILIILFISFILMAALNPYVKKLQRLKLPKVASAAIVYIALILAMVLLIIPLIPFFAAQIESLFSQFPSYLDSTTKSLGFNISAEQVQNVFANEIDTISQNAVGITQLIFGGLFSLLSILVISFYLVLDHEKVKQGFAKLFHADKRESVSSTLNAIEVKLGAWLRGQLILSLVIGSATWVALSLIGMPFALPLALIAGMLEIVPTLGPILSAIPASIIGFSISPTLGLITIGIYILIQALENNLIVPKVMQKAVGLNPIIIIIGIIIGNQLLGVAGALLSIPFITLITVIFTSVEKN